MSIAALAAMSKQTADNLARILTNHAAIKAAHKSSIRPAHTVPALVVTLSKGQSDSASSNGGGSELWCEEVN